MANCAFCHGELPSGAAKCMRCGEWVDARLALTGAAKFALGLAALECTALSLLAGWWVPAFRAMFRDFGSPLPLATRVVMQIWWMPLSIALLAASVLWALFRVRRARARESVLIATVMAGLLIGIATVWALYLPVFELSGHIKAD